MLITPLLHVFVIQTLLYKIISITSFPFLWLSGSESSKTWIFPVLCRSFERKMCCMKLNIRFLLAAVHGQQAENYIKHTHKKFTLTKT